MKRKNLLFFLIGVLVASAAIAFFLNDSTETKYYQEIAVTYNSSETPLVEVSIDGKTYSLPLDLGSRFPLTLNNEVLDNIPKTLNGTTQLQDIKGNLHEVPMYVLQDLKIGDLKLNNVIAIEEKSNSKIQELGSFGRPLLQRFNLLLDFKNSKIIVSNNISRLKKSGYDIDKMVKLPLEDSRRITLEATTYLGTGKFDLDTGATVNFLKASLILNGERSKEHPGTKTFTFPKFFIGDRDFGRTTLHLFNSTHDYSESVGCLGMSFLKEHIVYIDCINKFVYVGETTPVKTELEF